VRCEYKPPKPVQSFHQPIFTPHFTCRVCEQASTMIHSYIHTSITLSLATCKGSFCVICPWRSGDLVSLMYPRSLPDRQVKSSQVAPRSKDRLILSTSSRVAYAPPQYMQHVEERNGGMRECHNQLMTSQKLSDQVFTEASPPPTRSSRRFCVAVSLFFLIKHPPHVWTQTRDTNAKSNDDSRAGCRANRG
jgi:hypothetical protein